MPPRRSALAESARRGRPLSLFEEECTSTRDISTRLERSVRPADLERVDLRRAAQAERERLFRSGKVGLAAGDLLRERLPADPCGHAGAHRVAVRPAGAGELHSNALRRSIEMVEEDSRRPAVLDDDDVEVSVSVEVGIGGAAPDQWPLEIARSVSERAEAASSAIPV